MSNYLIHVFQIFISPFVVSYSILYLTFIWKTTKYEKLRTKTEQNWKINYFRKVFPIPVISCCPVTLPLRLFIHPEKTDEFCSIFWRLLGSFGRDLCFRWAVLSPWVLFHHFPIVHLSLCMFVTATAAMCRIDCSWPKSLWAHNQE